VPTPAGSVTGPISCKGGNVGIGVNPPLSLLHVNGVTRSEDRVEVRKGGSDTIAAVSGFFLGDVLGDYAGSRRESGSQTRKMKDSIELAANGRSKSLRMLADVSDAVGVTGVVSSWESKLTQPCRLYTKTNPPDPKTSRMPA
jgi:hypothetical protein